MSTIYEAAALSQPQSLLPADVLVRLDVLPLNTVLLIDGDLDPDLAAVVNNFRQLLQIFRHANALDALVTVMDELGAEIKSALPCSCAFCIDAEQQYQLMRTQIDAFRQQPSVAAKPN